jgi:uncharacterized protein YjiS (DUF1127 family)
LLLRHVGRFVEYEESAMLTSWILARIRREFQYRRSMQLLSTLSDRQLEDIGLDRMRLTAAAAGLAAPELA